ncbi:MAG: DEAD/DEAH box helicase family protein [Bacteroidetes bacterium]|nr:DEAD/DEAH box helicase family protein [Bacteroidota bacterium]
MPSKTIDQLIINSPYDEPKRHWHYERHIRKFDIINKRRPAGYLVASKDSKSFDDPGIFQEIPLVNLIRLRVKNWRNDGYPGVTSVTRRLLNYWHDPEEFETRRFFFCQLEAAETLIWLTEAPANQKVGLDITSDGGEFQRLCAKMATGSGKTVVMAMVIAWHILNKVANKQDIRFSKNVLVVAPGLTVKNRLAVVDPNDPDNYYESFRIVPSALLEKLRQGRVVIRNWHALNWKTAEQIAKKRGVDKRGVQSDEAYAREVLGKISNTQNLLIINDEAHHAWRVTPNSKRGVQKNELEKATKWIGGLDRIHKARGILKCYDFSATPFTPSGNQTREEALFGWIVTDFGLNDAIESGLVKTPRVVINDDALPDAQTYKSRLYHIYNDPEVQSDLNRKALPEEQLPDLVRHGYNLLGYDWRETLKNWENQSGNHTRPVMITVANRTETAARIKYMFDHKKIDIKELCDPERILHIDSKVLSQADSSEVPIADIDDDSKPKEERTKKQQAEFLRQQVDTVGQVGKPGEMIQNVISVGMLSEGWDAKTVTHIMGLRAFTSQLLCEQVVGRGLRRTTYDVNPETGFFDPEYVNIFGVPFTFLPHEGGLDIPPPPPKPKTTVEPITERQQTFEIKWPNVIRIEHALRTKLVVDWKKLSPLTLDTTNIPKLAELAPTVEGKPDLTKIKEIDLEKLMGDRRLQTIIFQTAKEVCDQLNPNWKGGRVDLLSQLVHLVEQFIARPNGIHILPQLLIQANDRKRKIIISLEMTKVVRYIIGAIRSENSENREILLDSDQPIRSTGDMISWDTSKPCGLTKRSHINYCVYDSTWEALAAKELDKNSEILAWVKNDHLGFEIKYHYRGIIRNYRPDFIIKLQSGTMLVLEIKGKENDETKAKHRFLQEWVRAVNEDRRFGDWSCDIALAPSEIRDILSDTQSR